MSPARAATFGRRPIGAVLAGQDAAREGAVGDDAEPIVRAARQQLGLDAARHRVVRRLAHDRRLDAGAAAQLGDACDAPGAKVREPEVEDLAGAEQVLHRRDGLLERRRRILLVEIEDLHPVGAEALQARVEGADHVQARRPPRRADPVGLASWSPAPAIAVGGDEAAVMPRNRVGYASAVSMALMPASRARDDAPASTSRSGRRNIIAPSQSLVT